ncbi:MAG: rhodanese-like domain-containing protein [Actinomycetaceae bacterium]|nr:rhodanese-like domain-containing protein [Actinomycetaceae bacterium]
MRKLVAVFASLVFVLGLSACSASADPVEVGPDTVVIDVRTAAEYDAGHLEGATLLDLNSGEFQAELPSLDPAGEYIVYCRSGNRSGQATKMMEDAGFENVTDLGSMENASEATGLAIE